MNNKFRIVLILLFSISVLGSIRLFSDGFIVIRPNPVLRPVHSFRPFPLAVKYHRVNVKIFNNVSETFIDQVFYNPTRRILEGFYIFPVPDGAVINRFSMFINGKETEAELLDAKKAKKIYTDIVREMKDPALLEYSGKRMFKVRIFPIEPMSEKRIKISYSEVLNKEGKTIEYIYPLNTEKFSSQPIKDVTIKVDIKSTGNIGNVYCPTHKTEIIKKSVGSAVVGFEASNVKPDRDFKVYFDSGKSDMNFSLKTFGNGVDDGFFFLNITPAFDISRSEILPKDVVFILDVSGSMAGKKIEQAKRALKFCINNLSYKDRFNIIKFSTEAESLFTASMTVNKKRVSHAIDFIDDLRAIGGTNIFEAIELGLKNRGKDVPPRTIILITDGKPTIGLTNEKELIKEIEKKNRGGTKIFTFGIGNDINTHLLDKLTFISGAFRSYISPNEDIEVKISSFFSKIESPVLTGLELKIDSPVKVRKVYPEVIPDLFKGSSVSLIGRFSGDGNAKIILKGRIMNRSKQFVFSGNFKKIDHSSDFIPKLWAARRVGFLLDQIRLNGENDELKNEVIRVARKYGIVTPYTSYLIVEDEKRSVTRRLINENDRLLTPSVFSADRFKEESARNHSSMKMKSGSLSVRASREIQQMYLASDYSQINQGIKRIPMKNVGVKTSGVRSVVQNINGRAFYNNGKFWVDSLVRVKKSLTTVKIKFLSEKYFKLLENNPSVSKFLFLGKNVKFIYNSIIYEISE